MRVTAVLDAVPLIPGPDGRWRCGPVRLHADRDYDHQRCRDTLVAQGIASRIARRGVESSQRLVRRRWVVDRTIAWLRAYLRLAVRYERRAELHQALLTLGCTLI